MYPSYEKLIRDGQVAVLYSPGYGAGWSTWASGDDAEAVTFDKDIAEAVLADDALLVRTIAARKYPDLYLGGAEDLAVKWVPQGSAFEITEYDGNESVHIIGARSYLIA